jgi:hypothetical protein
MKKLKFALLIPALLLFASCSKRVTNLSTSTAQGGQDSGGGDTVGSSYGQVEYYFLDRKHLQEQLTEIFNYMFNSDYSLKHKKLYSPVLMANPNLYRNVREKIQSVSNKIIEKENSTINTIPQERFYPDDQGSYTDISEEGYSKRRDEYRASITPNSQETINYLLLFGNEGESGPAMQFYPPGFIYSGTFIRKLKFKFVSTEACIDRYGNKKTGAVSDFDLESEICISANQLRKVPPESLKKQIYALLVHEIGHALGFYEEDSLDLQQAFLENYDGIMTQVEGDKTVQSLFVRKFIGISNILKIFLNDYPKNKILEKIKNKDKGFYSFFNYLYQSTEEAKTISEIFSDQIKVRQLNETEKIKIYNAIAGLNQFSEEMASLRNLTQNLETYGVSALTIKDTKKIEFLHERLTFFSEKLNFLGKELEDLN